MKKLLFIIGVLFFVNNIFAQITEQELLKTSKSLLTGYLNNPQSYKNIYYNITKHYLYDSLSQKIRLKDAFLIYYTEELGDLKKELGDLKKELGDYEIEKLNQNISLVTNRIEELTKEIESLKVQISNTNKKQVRRYDVGISFYATNKYGGIVKCYYRISYDSFGHIIEDWSDDEDGVFNNVFHLTH